MVNLIQKVILSIAFKNWDTLAILTNPTRYRHEQCIVSNIVFRIHFLF